MSRRDGETDARGGGRRTDTIDRLRDEVGRTGIIGADN